MSSHPLTKLDIQKYKNISRMNLNNLSRNNLSNILKDGTYVVNFIEYQAVGSHQVSLYVNDSSVTYIDSLCVKHVSKEIKKLFDSIICGYFCIGLIDVMSKSKSLTYFTDLFEGSSEQNGKVFVNYVWKRIQS